MGKILRSRATLPAMSDAKHAPATLRNREAIFAVLDRVLPRTGLVLEIASGTGEHATWIAPQLAGITWQPSDADPGALPSIAAWTAERAAANVLPPVVLDVCAHAWPVTRAAAVFCANMIHISPWAATEGLLRGAARVLPADGPLVLYGPYMIAGAHTAPSNAAFDVSLRARNPDWGVRDLDQVIALAASHGLQHRETITMPANNLSVVFRASQSFTNAG
jgi:hypothetical protein